VGEELLSALEDLRGRDERITAVRGRGLLVGVELETSELAERVVDDMRDAGVLINRTGPQGNVLKIRPPLVFTTEHVDVLVGALAAALAAATAPRI
jgi:4-aminobutyrate aminotransferase-like enzyme